MSSVSMQAAIAIERAFDAAQVSGDNISLAEFLVDILAPRVQSHTRLIVSLIVKTCVVVLDKRGCGGWSLVDRKWIARVTVAAASDPDIRAAFTALVSMAPDGSYRDRVKLIEAFVPRTDRTTPEPA